MTVPKTNVFIVGPARSGTSLLYRLLALNPQVSFISNWNARFPNVAAVSALQRATRSSRRLRSNWFQADGNAYVYGQERPLWKRIIPAPAEGEPVFSAAGILEDGSTTRPDSIEDLRYRIQKISRLAGGTHFVNKRVANNQRIPLIHEAMPDAHFVSIVRDGRPVALSLSRVDWWPTTKVVWAGVTPTQWAAQGNDPWELCAKNWVHDVEAIEQGLLTIPPDQQTSLTYESLVQDPAKQLTRLAESINLEIRESWIEEMGRINLPDHNEHWKAALSEDAIRVITEIQGDTLRRLGYLGTQS
ncbi:MAG: sulfotransferase [Armatimonadetes bacterium]|nr:MAG: sulfotransferase [Armatimonadota bacterium]